MTSNGDSGAGTLRQAILDANSIAGPDLITFNIAVGSPFIIQPLSALPAITDPVVIDGYSQPGASANTLVAGDNAVILTSSIRAGSIRRSRAISSA